MPAPPPMLTTQSSPTAVHCHWFVGYVNDNLPEPAKSHPANLVYAEYGPPILRRPNGEMVTLEQLSRYSATWAVKTTDHIIADMVRSQLAKKRADRAAARAASLSAVPPVEGEDIRAPWASDIADASYHGEGSLDVLETGKDGMKRGASGARRKRPREVDDQESHASND